MVGDVTTGATKSKFWHSYRFPFMWTIIAFAIAQRSLVSEYSELHRVHLHTGIVWCCEALFLVGLVSLVIGTNFHIDDDQHEQSHRISLVGVGVLVTVLSLILQFDVWKNIGRYSMFEQIHSSQNISEPLHK